MHVSVHLLQENDRFLNTTQLKHLGAVGGGEEKKGKERGRGLLMDSQFSLLEP